MTDLNQQLEEKKKELQLIYDIAGHPNFLLDDDIILVNKLKAEIAILEQAIAEIKSKDASVWRFICTNCKKESITDLRGKEKYLCYECAMQKQRQEILENLKKSFENWECYEDYSKFTEGEKKDIIRILEEKLNQQKTKE